MQFKLEGKKCKGNLISPSEREGCQTLPVASLQQGRFYPPLCTAHSPLSPPALLPFLSPSPSQATTPLCHHPLSIVAVVQTLQHNPNPRDKKSETKGHVNKDLHKKNSIAVSKADRLCLGYHMQNVTGSVQNEYNVLGIGRMK